MTNYSYHCARSGKWWAISVPGVRGVHTQARRLDQAEAVAREALAMVLDVDPYSFTLTRVIEGDVADIASRVQHMRDQAEEVQRAANRVTVAAINELQDHGLSLRDIGAVLGLSHQRVGQLAGENPDVAAIASVSASVSTESTPRTRPDHVPGTLARAVRTSAISDDFDSPVAANVLAAASERVTSTMQPLLAQWSAAMEPLRTQIQMAVEPILEQISSDWLASAAATALSAERPGQAMFEFVQELRPELAEQIRGTEADPSEDDARLPAFLGRVRELAHAA